MRREYAFSMDRLGNVLSRVLGKRGLAKQAQAALIVYRARNWLAQRLPDLAAFLTVENVKEGVLCIACHHSVAAQECQAITPALLDYLSQDCKFTEVSSIRLVRK